MVLVGKVNKDIVLRLNRHGQPAVGLCGDDGLLFRVARQAAPGGEDIGFVGRIERVDVDVLDHVAQDYIPVIASVGADREGNSYNVNADEAAGARRARARRLQGDVPDRRRAAGCATRPTPTSVISEATADEVEAALPGDRRRHAAEARGLRRRDPRRRQLRAHRRRPRPALAAARAVHRRRHRHEDQAGRMSLAELQALEARPRDPVLRALPVEFVRGEGTRLWDAEGNEYLDFLAGISVLERRPLPPGGRRGGARAGRRAHARRRTSSTPSRRCGWPQRLATSSLGGKVFFCNSGAEAERGGAQARAQGASRAARSSSCTAPSTAARTARCRATPQETKQAPFAPLVPGLRRRSRRRRPRSTRRSTSAPPRCCSSRSRARAASTPLPDELLRAARAACDRVGAALIFDEIQTGMGRTGTLWAYEQTGVVPDALTTAKALGGGLPIGALVTGERLADVFQPGDHGSTFAGGRSSPRPRSRPSTCSTTRRCWRACASWASGCATRPRRAARRDAACAAAG